MKTPIIILFLVINSSTFLFSQSHYNVYSIPYTPPVSYSSGNILSIGDDQYSNTIPLPFNFTFFDMTYNLITIGSNGVVSFNTSLANQYCPWSFVNQIPSSSLPTNSIFGAYHDLDLNSTSTAYIYYDVYGTAPNRIFFVNFYQIAQFSCTGLLTTQQIDLYEGTNDIDVYIESKPVCISWNSGNAVVGIQNMDGSEGIAAPYRNTGAWSAYHEAWRFSTHQPINDSLLANYYETDTLMICYGDSVYLCFHGNDSLPLGANENWYENGSLFYSGNIPPVQYPQNNTLYSVEYSDSTGYYSDSVFVVVNNPINIGINGLNNYYCLNSSPDTFSVFPNGALVIGPGINGNIFDPAQAGGGNIAIEVTYDTLLINTYQVHDNSYWSDDFSTDKGWTGYGIGGWERDSTYTSTSCTGSQCPALDNSAGNNNFIIGTYIGSCYPDLDTTYWLESPTIDCSGKNNCHLKFYSHSGFAVNDSAFIDVFDGNGWVNIADNSEFNNENAWFQHYIDVSAYADNNPYFKLRFGIGPVDTNYFQGWNIDDVYILTDTIQQDSSYCEYNQTYNIVIDTIDIVPSICLVTVDSMLNKNKIVWEKNDSTAETYFIYKETIYSGIYDLIGIVPANQPGVFIDTLSNPSQQSDKYKISNIDICGNISGMSDYHKTIHLNVSQAVPQGYALTWEHYEGFNFSTYIIYRKVNNNPFDSLTSIAYNPGVYTYTDLNSPGGNLYYYISAVKPTTCDTTLIGAKSYGEPYSQSLSNIEDNVFNDVSKLSADQFIIMPNPNDGKFYIIVDGIISDQAQMSVCDIQGKTVWLKNCISDHGRISQSISLDLAAGMYYMKINTDNNYIIKKIIIK